jgi:hypothetical protein
MSMNEKTLQKIEAMRIGGKALGKIKTDLINFVKVGTSFEAIEAKAQDLIKKAA